MNSNRKIITFDNMIQLGKYSSKYLLAIIIMAINLYFYSISKYGLGLTSDSISYWASAESFYKNQSFYLPFRKEYLSDWPPFFSIVLSSGYFLNVCNLFIYYGFLNYIIYILVVYNFYKLAYQLTDSNNLSLLSTLFLIISPAIYNTFSYLWSEPLFILLALLFIRSFNKYIVCRSQKFFYLSLLLAGLSAFTRYAGIVNIALAGIILLCYGSENLFTKFKKSIFFVFFSSLPLIFWITRNYIISKTLTGTGRTIEFANIDYVILQFTKAYWEWFFPAMSFKYGGVLTILLGTILPAIFLHLIIKFIKIKVRNWELLLILTALVAGFLAIVLLSAMLQSSDFPNYRLTSPAFIAFLLLLTYFVKHFRAKIKSIFNLSFVYLVISFIAVTNSYGFYKFTLYANNVGVIGYRDSFSRNSSLIKAAKELDIYHNSNIDSELFSNFAEKLYVNNLKGVYRITGGPKGKISKNFIVETESKTIIWFGDYSNLMELINQHLPNYCIVKINQYPDGFIVTLTLEEF